MYEFIKDIQDYLEKFTYKSCGLGLIGAKSWRSYNAANENYWSFGGSLIETARCDLSGDQKILSCEEQNDKLLWIGNYHDQFVWIESCGKRNCLLFDSLMKNLDR